MKFSIFIALMLSLVFFTLSHNFQTGLEGLAPLVTFCLLNKVSLFFKMFYRFFGFVCITESIGIEQLINSKKQTHKYLLTYCIGH